MPGLQSPFVCGYRYLPGRNKKSKLVKGKEKRPTRERSLSINYFKNAKTSRKTLSSLKYGIAPSLKRL